MAKKKTKASPKAAPKSTSKKSSGHGELFDKHPNLIWLLPIFLLIAAVAVIMYKNSLNPVKTDDLLDANQIPQVNTTVVTPNPTVSTEPSGY